MTTKLEEAKRLFDYIISSEEDAIDLEIKDNKDSIEHYLETLDAQESIELVQYCMDKLFGDNTVKKLFVQSFINKQNE